MHMLESLSKGGTKTCMNKMKIHGTILKIRRVKMCIRDSCCTGMILFYGIPGTAQKCVIDKRPRAIMDINIISIFQCADPVSYTHLSLFSMNLSRLFHCSVIKVLCSLPFSNFYILSDIQVLVNNFFIFLCCRLKRQPY